MGKLRHGEAQFKKKHYKGLEFEFKQLDPKPDLLNTKSCVFEHHDLIPTSLFCTMIPLGSQ